MDSLLGLSAILFGLISAGFGIYQLMRTTDEVRLLKTESEALVTKARAEVMQLEGFVDTISQKADERGKTVAELSAKLKDMTDLLSPEERENRLPVYVAIDRRAKGDSEYRGRVVCPRLSGDWQRGREYVLWSKDEETARRALETKFPPSGGYVIETISKSRNPL